MPRKRPAALRATSQSRSHVGYSTIDGLPRKVLYEIIRLEREKFGPGTLQTLLRNWARCPLDTLASHVSGPRLPMLRPSRDP